MLKVRSGPLAPSTADDRSQPKADMIFSAAEPDPSRGRADSGHSPQPRVNVAELIKAALQSVRSPGSALPQGSLEPEVTFLDPY